ncbi:tRNA lysidine(34) synthetase TilS [Burkholderia glumae]|uniref:tRNA(Ile)-lysidine synthase n=3 Tax=Burkholderia glumae TaxID=337 RepID=A0AAP9Y1W3_BURGL|nr:tRNA lysidine(34) synthetase TilS [Burkholderia glumae]ACR29444.1 tRNA-Ile-lysidine synthetase [Burkholderia glumae BGR1]AJY68066.1 tRNA(Ile)-lysidine synthetase [Burkholderia glumae LMG 2196 = ATCC 33617]KHJ63581.1 tRNA(Ile)-lysidine synthetase [Burkholderia glumae]MCM2482845.1 tRNA lysidine(34) synthetase TilS [Burkholderia glumae]MCM2492749.1 tRNA lysidine(34) synthetase TilS [Burkholderia glumae]
MISPHETAADRVVLDAVRGALDALPEAATIAIAYSGGLDSSVLLDAAVRVAGAARCVALHVHHGLSPNADAWLAHAAACAAALGVCFDAQRVEVPRESGLGVEASARELRYRALDALGERHGAQALWIAQHADDQAETVLLQLLRGAGLAGIAAMAPRYLPDGATIVRMRPLLSLLRAQLERYAEARALRWIDDESNADTRYARNALRARVLPELAVHFPGFRDALARTAQHAAAAQRLLDVLAADDLAGATRDDGRVLSRERLLGFDDERGANLLRHWMRTLGLPGASAARLAEMIKQLRAAQVSHALRIDHAGQCLRLYRDDVYWEAGDSADPADDDSAPERPLARLEWAGQEVWHLPAWRGSFVFRPVDAAPAAAAGASDLVAEAVLAGAPLVARARAGGERMRMSPGGPSRTLKNLFQERGVPAWQRDVPLLHVGETLLFVPRLGVNRAPEAGGAGAGVAGPCRRIEWRPDLLIA